MDPYVKLAKDTIETYIKEGNIIKVPEGLPEQMIEKTAGAFVSIHKNGMLRGCIGTISATTDSVALEIIQNAISASTKDPRFPAIQSHELSELEINVDVLGDAEPVSSVDELDAKKYGVIVECGQRRGLLLPDLEGVDTPQEQIDICRQKGGIGPDESVRLYRFEVIRHI